ncbi:hypothetical protein DRE_01235 [Drechslerella stenobrocha 248]|uniref:3-phytase n=1 Tax=Drechslerella stenobrocha 248 TaxID=1043628 RepID=W7HMS2_9PEZI|nr:hypothetical protein DRE_01235 [Drechslerella stenobrocha 248]
MQPAKIRATMLGVGHDLRPGRLKARWHKAAILLLVLAFVFFNWRRSCIASYSYTDKNNTIAYGDEACVSLIVFTANMFIWGLITPMVLLSDLAMGKLGSKRGICDSVCNGYACYKDISRSWGPYTPYFAVVFDDYNPKPDKNCKVTFAQILSRHGARYPTKAAGDNIQTTIRKIQMNATSYSKKTAFIKDFVYDLGHDDLTRFGEREMYNSGVKFYRRYENLARSHNPFIRVSGQQRVVDSGLNFTKGFIDEKKTKLQEPPPTFPPPTIIYEGGSFNNTLDHGICREFEDGKFSNVGAEAQAKYAAKYTLHIAARLRKEMPGVDIKPQDVVNLMALCPYYTVAKGTGETLSKFCDIFDHHEFQMYNHYHNLGKFYGYGPGNPLGPTQGIGFVNELIARLTDTPVNDTTSTNTTIDSDPETFPLGRRLYADFSHDNTMVSIFSAMNLFGSLQHISTQEIDSIDKFNVANLVPFAGRMYIEKLTCEGEDEELVRVLINDKVMDLDGCRKTHHGACKLSDFVGRLWWARDGGNWAECGW